MGKGPLRGKAALDAVADAPAHRVAEVLRGTLYTFPRPRSVHSRAASRLGSRLGSAFDEGTTGPGGWVILIEPELHLGPDPDILVPDLAGWRRERMPAMPDVAFFDLAPDWACEVLSPSTTTIDRTLKVPIYAREAVGHLWLVDPVEPTVEVLALEGEGYREVATHRDEAVVHAVPLEAVPLPLAALWER